MKRAGWVLAFALLLGTAVPQASALTNSERRARDTIYGLVNALRATTGDGVVTPDAFIEQVALGHSKKMARTNKLSHNGVGARETAIEANDPGTQFRCENVAFVGGSYTARSAAKKIFRLWKRSSGHYKCMTDFFGVADEIGVGVKKKGNTWWATLITARD